MRIFHLAKRRYTSRDTLTERFGRVYQLPCHWSATGQQVHLALLDYHSIKNESASPDDFPVWSLSLLDPRSLFRLRALVARFKPDVVISSGDCFIGLVGLYLARSHSISFVLDAYDDYSSFGSYRMFLGWDAFSYLLGNADTVWYASRTLADRHVARSPWMLVPNGVDTSKFHPVPLLKARSSIGLTTSETKIVGYLGSMEPDRGIDDLIAATGILHADNPHIRLLLCGTLRPDMKPLPSWVDYRGVVPHSIVPDYINACDVVALPYRRSQIMDMGASCKIAEYLFCRRPISATRTPNFVQNFPDQAKQLDTLLAPPGDISALANSIRRQLNKPTIVQPPDDLTWQNLAERAMTELQHLLEQK